MMKTACKVGRLGRIAWGSFLALLIGNLLVSSLGAQSLPAKLGDLDTNGVVDVRDLVRLVNHVQTSAGSPPPGGTGVLPSNLRPFADLNGDTLINQTDIDLLGSLILGIPLPNTPVTLEPANGASEVGVTVCPQATYRSHCYQSGTCRLSG